MDKAATANPIMISLINMTVVFAVLYGLSWVIRLIKLIDPTQKKSVTKAEQAAPAPAAPAPVVPEPAPAQQDDDEIVAVIAAALAAYGYSQARIASIRPIGGRAWAQAARLDAVSTRNQMY